MTDNRTDEQKQLENDLNQRIEIDMKPVESGNILEIGYKDLVLRVKFKGGGLYNYYEVPPEIHEAFIEADSKGSFLSKNIRGAFEYERIN